MATPSEDFGDGVKATKAFVGSNVEDLPVIPTGQGHVSCWKLTPAEIARVMTTGRIYLWTVGPEHPPVAISTDIGFTKDSASRDGELHA